MTERLSRKELYDLVWSEPMKTLSARFGISDVGLKKACTRGDIPVPNRGFWAKRQAGKKVVQADLPQRPPGMDDEVLIGGGKSWCRHWNEAELRGPLPPPPEFPEPIEAVRARIARAMGKITVAREPRLWHPAINLLLKQDDERRAKQLADRYRMPWNEPLFDTPPERRRLRILNSLFLAAGRMRGRAALRGREAREISLTFHQQTVSIELDQPKRRAHAPAELLSDPNTKLRLSVLLGVGSASERTAWADGESGTLEGRMKEIAIEVVLAAEIQHRERAVAHYKWRVERKAALEEEARKRAIEAERAEHERQKRLEQARVDRLPKDAVAFRQAADIRQYVEALRAAQSSHATASAEQFEQWSRWALAQADRIDPTLGGAFLKAIRDEGEA